MDNNLPLTPASPHPLLKRIFISPDEPRLRAGWRLLTQMILLFVLVILMGMPLAILQILGISLGGMDMLAAEVLMLFAITGSIYLARRFIDRRSFTSLGLRLDARAARDTLVGIAIAGLMMGLIFLLQLALSFVG